MGDKTEQLKASNASYHQRLTQSRLYLNKVIIDDNKDHSKFH